MKQESAVNKILDDLRHNKMVAQVFMPELEERLVWLYMAGFEEGVKSGHTTTSIPVQQFTLWGGFVEEYESIKEAHEFTGINKNLISRCVNGKLEEAGGYKWKYKNQ